MSLNSAAVIQAAIDHLAATGIFESVNAHETTSAPVATMTADVWLSQIRLLPAESGLDVTSALLTLYARIYISADSQPYDGIETQLASAVDVLMNAYNGAFTFNDTVTYIDLLGAHGSPLAAVGGYIDIGDTKYRCMTVSVPCVIDDVWPQDP